MATRHDHGRTAETRAQTSARTGTIDVHAHFLPPAYRAALDAAGLTTLDGGMAIPDWSVDRALETMAAHDIATAILSVSSPGLNFTALEAEAPLARAINDAATEIIAAHPGRFGAFATLPVGDVPASLKEIDRIFDRLGLDGVILETNHHGCYPGAAEMAPILAALNARKACVFLHPTSPACLECLSGGRPAPLIEFPFETTRAVVDLIYSGTLTRYPDIRFILAHAGGVLPFLAQRIAGFTMAMPAVANGLKPGDVVAQLARLFYDTALSATETQITALRDLVPVSQILFGSDWPFSPTPMLGGSIAALEAMQILSSEDRLAIFRGNAERLLPRHAR